MVQVAAYLWFGDQRHLHERMLMLRRVRRIGAVSTGALLCSALISFPLVAADPIPPERSISDEIIRFDRATRELDSFTHLNAVIGRYRTLTTPYAGREGTLGVSGVEDLFEATYSVLALWADPREVATLRALYGRLAERGALQPKHVRRMYQAERALFEDGRANALVAGHPGLGLEPVAPLRRLGDAASNESRRVIALGDEGTPYERRLPRAGNRLVVLVHPLCAPSNRAIAALSDSDRLRPLLDTATLLVRQEVGTDTLAEVRRWNAQHPPRTMYLVSTTVEEWSDLAAAATPAFFLLHDDDRLERISEGMPDEAMLEKLHDAVLGNGPKG
ncbi:MAG TPA: hypothetical protein DDZ67_07635 [Xanthomonadaceae bacterium]|nr:hypothetical protein [Xanthomonadaceae bacterium]